MREWGIGEEVPYTNNRLNAYIHRNMKAYYDNKKNANRKERNAEIMLSEPLLMLMEICDAKYEDFKFDNNLFLFLIYLIKYLRFLILLWLRLPCLLRWMRR